MSMGTDYSILLPHPRNVRVIMTWPPVARGVGGRAVAPSRKGHIHAWLMLNELAKAGCLSLLSECFHYCVPLSSSFSVELLGKSVLQDSIGNSFSKHSGKCPPLPPPPYRAFFLLLSRRTCWPIVLALGAGWHHRLPGAALPFLYYFLRLPSWWFELSPIPFPGFELFPPPFLFGFNP